MSSVKLKKNGSTVNLNKSLRTNTIDGLKDIENTHLNKTVVFLHPAVELKYQSPFYLTLSDSMKDIDLLSSFTKHEVNITTLPDDFAEKPGYFTQQGETIYIRFTESVDQFFDDSNIQSNFRRPPFFIMADNIVIDKKGRINYEETPQYVMSNSLTKIAPYPMNRYYAIRNGRYVSNLRHGIEQGGELHYILSKYFYNVGEQYKFTFWGSKHDFIFFLTTRNEDTFLNSRFAQRETDKIYIEVNIDSVKSLYRQPIYNNAKNMNKISNWDEINLSLTIIPKMPNFSEFDVAELTRKLISAFNDYNRLNIVGDIKKTLVPLYLIDTSKIVNSFFISERATRINYCTVSMTFQYSYDEEDLLFPHGDMVNRIELGRIKAYEEGTKVNIDDRT